MKRVFLAAYLLVVGAGGAAASYVPGTDPVVQDNTADTVAGIGTPGASPYAGSGSASVIAVLKGVFSKLAGTLTTNDTNSAAFVGAVSITPGTPVTAARSLAYLCTGAGTVTLTYADTSTQTVTLPAATYPFATIPSAVTNVTLGTASGCTFWNMQ